MQALIVGCGRVGAGLAEALARAGNDVTILDTETDAFSRLEADFPGKAIRGDGTDEDVLRRAGAAEADIFVALTEGDNRNILAAQLAAETFGVEKVVAKVNDPVRAQAYTALGIATLNRTRMLVDAVATHLGLPADPGARGVSPPSGTHHGGKEHTPLRATAEAANAATRPAAAGVAGPAPAAREG
jgi:trk system potassium uptake protein TrkA